MKTANHRRPPHENRPRRSLTAAEWREAQDALADVTDSFRLDGEPAPELRKGGDASTPWRQTRTPAQRPGAGSYAPCSAIFRRAIGPMPREATAHRHNVIIRPRGSRVTFIQLDDLPRLEMARVQPVALLCLETGPGK